MSRLLLVVIDGFGVAPASPGNAVRLARTPHLDRLAAEGSGTILTASGLPVGLPDGQQGNSEVGHLNLGAGRRVPQMLVRIDESISDGSFFANPAFAAPIAAARSGTLHLMGLIGSGGVHAVQRHLDALLELARRERLERVVVHALTDGRDSRPDAALGFIEALEGAGVTVGTVVGRYLAMDRDKRWDRTGKAYNAIVHGSGERVETAAEAIRRSYAAGVGDEFIEPHVVGDPSANRLRPGDGLIYWNFRPDRARQLTEAFTSLDFDGFDRGGAPQPVMATMTRYQRAWDIPAAYEAEDIRQGLSESVSLAGRSQLHIAETEKYAHVTYFFNGGQEVPFDGEERVLVPSPQHVATYDEAPEMSAAGVRDAVLAGLLDPANAFMVVNFANADMVGHTGVIPAAVRAIETVDACMGDIRAAAAAAGVILAVTADHGNSEYMLEPDGSPNTAHTTNPVPLWIDRPGITLADNGKLGDVGPTLLGLAGWDAPAAMTGKVLI